MGYCQKQAKAQFFMRAEDCPLALAALKGAVTKHVEEHGKLRWIESADLVLNMNTLDGALEQFGWELDRQRESYDVVGIDWTWEKGGDELVALNAIALWVKEGSFIEMHGEGGYIWRYIFRNGQCREVPAQISFPEE